MEPSQSLLDPNVTGIVNMDMSKKDLVEIAEVETLQHIATRRAQIETRLGEICALYGFEYWPAMRALDEKEQEKLQAKYVPQFEAVVGKPVTIKIRCSWKYKESSGSHTAHYVVFYKQSIGYYAVEPIGASHEIDLSAEGFSGSLTIPADKTYFKEALKEWRKRTIAMQEAGALNKEQQELDKLERELPLKLKAFSAALSKKALGSSPKGAKLLKLLDEIKNTAKI